jgi:hypothetical protein
MNSLPPGEREGEFFASTEKWKSEGNIQRRGGGYRSLLMRDCEFLRVHWELLVGHMH